MRKRLDIGRSLVIVTSAEAVNRVVRVKINNGFHDIRMLEEPFSKVLQILNSDKNYCSSVFSSSETSDFVLDTFDSLKKVSETRFSSSLHGEWEAEVDEGVEISKFEKIVGPEEKLL